MEKDNWIWSPIFKCKVCPNCRQVHKHNVPLRICSLNVDDIVVGIVVKGLVTGKLGKIVKIDCDDDNYAWI